MRKLDDLIHRVRAEYWEMPGLRLKAEQVERLCGIERAICQRVLDSFVTLTFLGVQSDGRYARSADSHHPASAVGGESVQVDFWVATPYRSRLQLSAKRRAMAIGQVLDHVSTSAGGTKVGGVNQRVVTNGTDSL
jgi:hypothetical protein